jgi:hypothetical protein
VEARQIPVAQVPVIPVAADAAQKSIEMPQTAPPTENSVKTEKTGTRKADVRQTTPATGAAQAPYVAVPVPVAVPLPPLPVISTASAPRHTEAAAVQPKSEESAEKAPPTDTVLQVTIRNPNGETVPAPVAATPVVVPTPVVAVPVKPEPVRSAPEVPVVASANSPAAATALNPAAPAATQAAPSAPAESPRPAAEAKAPVEPTLPPDPPQQQIKSVSLEFSPDGAGDVKLRVSERGGEVHISLHSSDASLSGKIHEGVHDLVGSLSSAGYDAEAWTPGQGHHGAQQQQEQRKPPRPDPDEAGAEDFGGLFEQPIQEVS